MTCGGCSGAIERVLKKNIEARTSPLSTPTPLTPPFSPRPPFQTCRGKWDTVAELTSANAFTVSLPNQRVLVWGPSLPPFETVTEKIAKTGKQILAKEVVEDQGRLVGLQA